MSEEFPARVLIVDDEPATCIALTRALTLMGYWVDSALSGQEAPARLDAAPYDVMVLDLRLPDIRGEEVLQRAWQIQPDLLVIILTAYASLDSAIAAVRAGAIDYLLKPYSIRALEEAIARALHRRREQMRRERLLRVIAEAVEQLGLEEPAGAPSVMAPRRFLRQRPVTLDREKRVVIRADRLDPEERQVPLTASEAALLEYLMERPEVVVSCRELAQVVARCQSGSTTSDQKVWDAIVRLAIQNGIQPEAGDEIAASYIDRNERYLGPVGSGYIPTGATGVTVVLTATRPTAFLQLVGESRIRAAARAVAMSGPVTQFPGGILPIAVPLQVVQALSPGQPFVVMETNQQNGGMFCTDRNGNGRLDEGIDVCIGDPASHNAHRGWLNLNYIYNTQHLRRADPNYRTFEQNVPNRGCGPDPNTSADDGLQGWASGECPYPFPIFAGNIGYTNGDFIHGDPGARQSSLMEIANYIGQTAYVPVFDYIYMSDYMEANFPAPEGIGWPRAGGGGHAFLYHVVGFTRVQVGNVRGHTLVGTFQEAVIGEGAIQPGYGVGSGVCQPLVAQGVTLWR